MHSHSSTHYLNPSKTFLPPLCGSAMHKFAASKIQTPSLTLDELQRSSRAIDRLGWAGLLGIVSADGTLITTEGDLSNLPTHTGAAQCSSNTNSVSYPSAGIRAKLNRHKWPSFQTTGTALVSAGCTSWSQWDPASLDSEVRSRHILIKGQKRKQNGMS